MSSALSCKGVEITSGRLHELFVLEDGNVSDLDLVWCEAAYAKERLRISHSTLTHLHMPLLTQRKTTQQCRSSLMVQSQVVMTHRTLHWRP